MHIEQILRKYSNWKKVLLLILIAFIMIRIIYIVNGEVDREYYTSANLELKNSREIPCENVVQIFRSDQERLHGIEFVLNNIAIDEKGMIVLSICSSDELIFRSGISLSNIKNNEWKKIYINLLKLPTLKMGFAL